MLVSDQNVKFTAKGITGSTKLQEMNQILEYHQCMLLMKYRIGYYIQHHLMLHYNVNQRYTQYWVVFNSSGQEYWKLRKILLNYMRNRTILKLHTGWEVFNTVLLNIQWVLSILLNITSKIECNIIQYSTSIAYWVVTFYYNSLHAITW